MNNPEILNQLIAQATTELFADYSFPVTFVGRVEAPPALPEIAGVISFFGTDITGTIALATSRQLIDAKAAATPGVVSSTDWLAELTNQLLGRIKRLLAAQSATIYLGTPVAVSGRELEFSARGDRAAPTCNLFLAAQGGILVWSDVQYAEGFEFHSNTDGDDGADAGDTIFF
jgi:hypothetical protein